MIEAQKIINAERNFSLILPSHSPTEVHLSSGEFIKIYIKKGDQKSETWSNPKVVIGYDISTSTFTAAGKNWRTIHASIEDTWAAMPDESLSAMISQANDVLDIDIEEIISSLLSPYK